MNEQVKEAIRKVLRHPATIPTAVGVASGVGGYFLGKKLMEMRATDVLNRYQRALDEANNYSRQCRLELARFRQNTDDKRLVGTLEPVVVTQEQIDQRAEDPVTQAEEILRGIRDIPIDNDLEPDEVQEAIGQMYNDSVAADLETPAQALREQLEYRHDEDEWDWEVEQGNRGDGPYIIHHIEYTDSSGFPQEVLTWYEGDKVLAGEDDQPIFNVSEVVGDRLDFFGHGSGDPNVVYIRNSDRMMEYEVLRHTGSYAVEVQGEEPGTDTD